MSAVQLSLTLITLVVGFGSASAQRCGRTYFDSNSGTIQSPNYPYEYADGLICNYYVAVPSGMSVIFRFDAFVTEACCDHLTFSCVTGEPFGPMTFKGVSQLSNLTIHSCRQVNLHFVTDGSVVGTGFSISYSFLTGICGPLNYEENDGTIVAPHYPSEYPNRLNCNYSVVVPSGMSVFFRFKEYEIRQCCDHLTFSCVNESAFGPRTFRGGNQPSTLFIPSCRQVNLFFFANHSVQYNGFSLSYSFVPGAVGSFILRPSNVFLQADTTVVQLFTLNCTSSREFFPWWSNNRWSVGYNETVTNGFCNVSANYSSTFSSESLGPGSCNLIAIAQARSYYASVFVCNYGTQESAGLLLVPLDPGFVFSKGNVSASTINELEPQLDNELKFICAPKIMHYPPMTRTLYLNVLGRPPNTAAQFRILRSYWTNETGIVLSRETSSYISALMVKAHSLSGVFPIHTCNIDVQFVSNISYMDRSAPIAVAFPVKAVQASFGPIAEKMSLSGNEKGAMTSGGILSCYAHAHPPATYQWTNEGNGQLVSGPTIVVTQPGQYTCTASNFFNTKFHRGFKTIAVEISDQRFVSNLGVAFGAVSLVINMIFGILLIHRCRKNNTDTVRNQGNCEVDALRLEPVGRLVNDYGSQKEDNDDELYANGFPCDRISTRNSETSDPEAVYEAV